MHLVPKPVSLDDRPSLARQLAMREAAKVAMCRLHVSRGLRKAELARSRSSTITEAPAPGDLVYYWRMTKYNNKTQRSRRKLSLRLWHGPGLVVAIEGNSSAYISHKGQLTKCALEHVRPASAIESIAAGVWRDAIEDVVAESIQYSTEKGTHAEAGGNGGSDGLRGELLDGLRAVESPQAQHSPREHKALDLDFGRSLALDLPPVSPQEIISSMQAPSRGSSSSISPSPSTLPSAESSRRASGVSSLARLLEIWLELLPQALKVLLIV